LKKQFNLSLQVLTITAGVNIIAFVIRVGYYHREFTTNNFSYSDMILEDIHMIPYVLKEIVSFYYILLLVASVNTLHDNLAYKLNMKCLQLKNDNKDLLNDYIVMHLDAHSYTSILKLGPIEVRRKRVLLTLVTLVLYCLYILTRVRKSVKA